MSPANAFHEVATKVFLLIEVIEHNKNRFFSFFKTGGGLLMVSNWVCCMK